MNCACVFPFNHIVDDGCFIDSANNRTSSNIDFQQMLFNPFEVNSDATSFQGTNNIDPDEKFFNANDVCVSNICNAEYLSEDSIIELLQNRNSRDLSLSCIAI